MADGRSTVKLGKASASYSTLFEKQRCPEKGTISTCIQHSGTLHM